MNQVYAYRWATQYQTVDGARMVTSTTLNRKYEEYHSSYFFPFCTGKSFHQMKFYMRMANRYTVMSKNHPMMLPLTICIMLYVIILTIFIILYVVILTIFIILYVIILITLCFRYHYYFINGLKHIEYSISFNEAGLVTLINDKKRIHIITIYQYTNTPIARYEDHFKYF